MPLLAEGVKEKAVTRPPRSCLFQQARQVLNYFRPRDVGGADAVADEAGV
jgi:hypothetical protein